ncbi:hypoxanthine phosphoribosyltransferase [Candidatus Sulfidibacterium hydrothermale]|uniref:hypoxanthine phosphoribosyltransferase n=1 Tax=Candidatus Sulfidibacterium hydrothermale TaxID=2875962 RepID=UPI001F0AC182|nr:hypoxanthine phosphoribosyltransferase [Candidatus Sulfidibacterium hydrothermale]UBM63333.1 hypoxanthine phosphoribosyltransferase [Candidatus Sulfidibacterium hydrothermale]
MATITVLDKVFEPYIPHEKILEAVRRMAKELERDLADKNPLFLVILNGAFMFAGDLFKELHFPAEISFIKFVSYSGTHSTGNVRQLIGLDEDVAGRTVVLVEDIVDTGISMEKVLEYLSDKKIKDLRIATLLFKPNSYKKHFKIDYIGIEIPNDFIIGYGLDYNGQARNLKDIYKIVQ